jgi:hypothetical protein
MREMKPQRRQKSVGGKERLDGGNVDRQLATGHRGNGRDVRLGHRAVRTSPGRVEKNARLALAFVPAMMLLIAAARRIALVGAPARLYVDRFERTRIAALLRACMGVVPAAPEHCVQCQEEGHQR